MVFLVSLEVKVNPSVAFWVFNFVVLSWTYLGVHLSELFKSTFSCDPVPFLQLSAPHHATIWRTRSIELRSLLFSSTALAQSSNCEGFIEIRVDAEPFSGSGDGWIGWIGWIE